jgi:hypothetical protein
MHTSSSAPTASVWLVHHLAFSTGNASARSAIADVQNEWIAYLRPAFHFDRLQPLFLGLGKKRRRHEVDVPGYGEWKSTGDYYQATLVLKLSKRAHFPSRGKKTVPEGRFKWSILGILRERESI